MDSVLEFVRFLSNNPEWLQMLKLRSLVKEAKEMHWIWWK